MLILTCLLGIDDLKVGIGLQPFYCDIGKHNITTALRYLVPFLKVEYPELDHVLFDGVDSKEVDALIVALHFLALRHVLVVLLPALLKELLVWPFDVVALVHFDLLDDFANFVVLHVFATAEELLHLVLRSWALHFELLAVERVDVHEAGSDVVIIVGVSEQAVFVGLEAMLPLEFGVLVCILTRLLRLLLGCLVVLRS